MKGIKKNDRRRCVPSWKFFRVKERLRSFFRKCNLKKHVEIQKLLHIVDKTPYEMDIWSELLFVYEPYMTKREWRRTYRTLMETIDPEERRAAFDSFLELFELLPDSKVCKEDLV